MANRMILKIDLVLIIGSLVVLVFLVGYVSPLVIAPLDNYESLERRVLFSIEKADRLLIDDNMEFSSPDEYSAEDGLKIDLEPGKYYWKAVGVVNSEVRTLTINSEVSLELRVSDEGNYEVVNAGNVWLDVDVYDGEELVDKVKLSVGDGSRELRIESEELEGTKFIGEMG